MLLDNNLNKGKGIISVILDCTKKLTSETLHDHRHGEHTSHRKTRFAYKCHHV